MRAIAALIVVYDHLVGMWLQRNQVSWRPSQLADRWIFEPLHLMSHGGALAVALFFMVSGFVIVYVAQRESRRDFAIRRALRIYPPFWMSCLLFAAVYVAATAVSSAPGLRGFAVEQALAQPNPLLATLAALTLGNYLIGTPAINGVAWTLVIEVLFYIAVALLLPLLKTRPRLAIGVAFAVLALLQAIAKTNVVVFLLAVNSVHVAYMFLGSLAYLRWAGRIGTRFFVTATVVFWGLFVHGVAKIVLQAPYSLSDYGVSYAMAWLLFVAILLLDEKLRLGGFAMFFSRISYSLYLNHGGIGLIALTLLYPALGYPMSLAITFVLVVAISAAAWRWVEVPSQRLARRWTARPA
ncbi:MAG: acyltransferase [Burkholderiales bacterium]|nr:acyltransferase [Burkholderiales bacterium]